MWQQEFRDHQLALQLQVNTNTPGSVDLELSDPTPDVHSLFIQFNHRFFSGRLASVVVRWSKRMYSCAGICRYKGNEGFCDIALSEPLLKLRPRKNLVETLLHEMIHAYLFITDNDRDRDGHGPKFHQHMYRINREANVNITVYHTFSDEVNLYKTHWWRCDGPCRDRRPFFGTVRRSSNRAPGPYDNWWQRHLSSCSGKFIKIKEPEKKQPKSKNTTVKTFAKDIRTFFDSTKKVTSKTKPSNESNQISKKFKPNVPGSISQVPPITKYSDVNCNTPNYATATSTASRPTTNSEVVETVRNHWLNKFNQPTTNNQKINTLTNNSISKPIESNIKPTQDGPMSSYNTILQDLYGKEVILKPDNFKRPLVKLKQEESNTSYYSKCPVCDVSISNNNLETHISTCIEMFSSTDFNESTSTEVVDLTHLGESPTKSDNDLKSCPTCDEKIPSDYFDEHLEDCLNKTFSGEDLNMFGSNVKTSNIIYLSDEDDELNIDNNFNRPITKIPCPICLNFVEESLINFHLDMCLS